MTDLPASQMPSVFQVLFEAIPEPYLALAPDGAIVAVNDAFLYIAAADRMALINHNFFELISTSIDSASINPATDALRSSALSVQTLTDSFKAALQYRSPQTVLVADYPRLTKMKEISEKDISEIDHQSLDWQVNHVSWVVTQIPILDTANRPVYVLHRLQQLTGSCSTELPFQATQVSNHCEDPTEQPIASPKQHQPETELQHAETELRDLPGCKQVEEKQQFLVQASAILSSSLDYEVTLRNLSRLIVPTIADWCVIDIISLPLDVPPVAQRVAVAHADPTKQALMEQLRQYPLNLQHSGSVIEIIRTGRSFLSPEVLPEQLEAAAQDATHLELLQALNPRSGLGVPLMARGQVLGVMYLATSTSNRRYRVSDLVFAEELAHRAAIAVDNARLYQEARRLQQVAEHAAVRTSRLQALTAALSESATLVQVADVTAQHSLSALGAAIVGIALLRAGGTNLDMIRIAEKAQASEFYPHLDCDAELVTEIAEIHAGQTFSIETPLLITDAIRTKQLQAGFSFARHCGELQQAEPSPETTAETLLAEKYRWVAVPLLVKARAIGGIVLAFDSPQTFNQEDRSFIQALALQCAQAIERARLYEAEQRAREAAETANRLKDEFLTMLSHELRSPLNPILGWVKLLQTRSLKAETMQYALTTIERNAKLQAQLIEDLLDVSRILCGRLTLNFRLVQLNATIRAALESVQLAAANKSIQIYTSIAPSLPPVWGDANRLQQVIANLLSNAIKFTPVGGWINVQLKQVDRNSVEEQISRRIVASPSSPFPPTLPRQGSRTPSFHYAQITVSDTGQGITPEFLPYVFESFRQADATTTRKFGGLGLGLAIVQQIVKLHGGYVVAESAGEEQGATFTIWLPLRSDRNDTDK
jgi:signal transduction histidine kinase